MINILFLVLALFSQNAFAASSSIVPAGGGGTGPVNSQTFTQQGSTPAAPAAGKDLLYFDSSLGFDPVIQTEVTGGTVYSLFAVPNSTSRFYGSTPSASLTGARNYSFSAQSMTALTAGTDNMCIGFQCLQSLTLANQSTCMGTYCLNGLTQDSSSNTCMGYACLDNLTTFAATNSSLGSGSGASCIGANNSTFVGANSDCDSSAQNPAGSLALGRSAHTFADHTATFGSTKTLGFNWTDLFFNGYVDVQLNPIVIHGTGGSGLNNAGSNITIAGGQGTGTAAGGSINFQTAPVGGSSSTLNALATVMSIDTAGNVTVGANSSTILPNTTSQTALGSTSKLWKGVYSDDTGYYGRPDGNTPGAGTIGESFRVASTTYTNTAATTQWKDMNSVALTAGHWLCALQAQMSLNGAVMTEFAVGISTSTGNAFADLAEGDNEYESAALPVGSVHQGATVAGYQIQIGSTTTYYAKVKATFSAGNPQYVYRLQCNRKS